MSSDVLVRLRGIGKAYPRRDTPGRQLLRALWPRLQGKDEFRALWDVDLDVRRGEAVGIIGRNGSGKSTLLQLVTGILQPTAGEVEVRGRVAALLELGAGFNPEFTGRENIRLNASLLGLSEAEIDARMPAIVAFAEIGDHVEQQVKTYSSGMFMRLAFAVAVHTDPDVLIVDEALSVGDVYFQRKCFRRIEEMRENGTTLLFVTHSLDSVIQLCDRGVVLDRGRLVFDGDTRAATREYLRRVFGDNAAVADDADVAAPSNPTARETSAADELAAFLAGGARDDFASRAGYNRDESRLGDGSATTCDFLLESSLGHGPLLPAREPFRLRVRYHFPQALDRLVFGVRVTTVTGQVVYSANTMVTEGRLYAAEAGSQVFGAYDLRCALLPGYYFMTVGVSRVDGDREVHAVDRRSESIILRVTGVVAHAEGTADMEGRFNLSADTGALRPMA